MITNSQNQHANPAPDGGTRRRRRACRCPAGCRCWTPERDAAMRRALGSGVSQSDIAKIANLSRQRISAMALLPPLVE